MPWGACLLLRAFERPLARPAAVHLQALRAVDPRGPLRPLPLARRRCPAAMAAVVASASAEGEGESFHDREGCRFGVRMGGEEAYVSYAISDADRTIDILSTFTPVSLRGKGLASKVVAQAFEYAREKGYRVIPTCSYVPVFVEKNPQWTDLVAE